ncbi:hypothetical protein ONZ51_g8250 [Trametes cubensis]|uniref:DUF4100 domain-containing protein n=1 Tax=Trametes cubensis TaxID=1111947 RepID=A0AAD7TNK8_9APHY|nr:hypothetical protein ONZ51_g8250 [Trametes cubensis]
MIRVLPVQAMPDPKDKKAPNFKRDNVHDFVESLELLALLVDEHVFSGTNWEAAKKRLVTLYESQTKKYKPTVEKLRHFVVEEQKKSSEERKKQNKKLSRTDPPSMDEAWKAAHDYFDTNDINRITRKSRSESESDSSTDKKKKKGKSKKKRATKKYKKSKKKGKAKKSSDVDDKIQQLTDRLQGLATLMEKGVQAQRFGSPSLQPSSSSQVPFFPSQQPATVPSNVYTNALGTQENKKCFMCGKTEGVDLDHRFGFKLVWADGKLLPQFTGLGQGGLAAYLRNELAQRAWTRDPPPHQQASCMSLGLCRDDVPIFSYEDSGEVVPSQNVFSFPATTRAKSREQKGTKENESSKAINSTVPDKIAGKQPHAAVLPPHVANTEDG